MVPPVTSALLARIFGVGESVVANWVDLGVISPEIGWDELADLARPHLGGRTLPEFLAEAPAEYLSGSDQSDLLNVLDADSVHRPLLHYTKAATALDHILSTGRLRLAPPLGVNDPWESGRCPISFSGISPGPIDAEVFLAASNHLRNSCRLACFSQSGPYGMGYAQVGEGYTRARMWAQYAENHHGVCLAFDRGRLREALLAHADEKGLRLYEGAVWYREKTGAVISLPYESARTPATLEAVTTERFPLFVSALYFTKSWDWCTETEYRFLLNGAVQGFEDVDIRRALAAVFCGLQFPRPQIRDLADRCPELLEANRLWRVGHQNGRMTAARITKDEVRLRESAGWDVPPMQEVATPFTPGEIRTLGQAPFRPVT